MQGFMTWLGGPLGLLGLVFFAVAARQFWKGEPLGGVIYTLLGFACVSDW